MLPTIAENESFAGVVYRLDGELAPVVKVELPAAAKWDDDRSEREDASQALQQERRQ